MSPTMRTIRQATYGGPEVLELVEAARPAPAPTEILVGVHAAGVNPVDWKTRAGDGIAGLLGAPPLTVGWDTSGVVEAVGFGVTRFAPGDEVYGMPHFPRQAAGYAEYVTAPSRHFAHKPATLSHVEAAGLPLAGLTAWQSLVDTARLQPGQRVLIHGAAGGVGHLAVQIAKALGGYVIGTARAVKHDFLHDIGADETIDYTAVDVDATVRGVDVVLDLVGGHNSIATLNRGGTFIAIPNAPDPATVADAQAAGVRVAALLVEPDGHALQELARLADAGKVRVHVDATLPLAEAAKAHELGQAGTTTGKLVLTVR